MFTWWCEKLWWWEADALYKCYVIRITYIWIKIIITNMLKGFGKWTGNIQNVLKSNINRPVKSNYHKMYEKRAFR